MKSASLILALLVSTALLAASCISGGTSGPQPCQPGTTGVCYCPGGGQGTATCSQQGYMGQCSCSSTNGDAGGDQDTNQGLDAAGDTGQTSDAGSDTSGGQDTHTCQPEMIPECMDGNVYERNSCTNALSSSPVDYCETGCESGACTTCTPSCGSAECGPDGCGGTCGSCGTDQSCNASGMCETNFGSCQEPTDYYGVNLTGGCAQPIGSHFDATNVETECQETGGTYSSQPCETNDAIGMCRGWDGQRYETLIYFNSPEWTNTDAQQKCSQFFNGTYTSL